MFIVLDVLLCFSDCKLFDEVNINFIVGNIYGFIGVNGVGKLIFFKILVGDIELIIGYIVFGLDECFFVFC